MRGSTVMPVMPLSLAIWRTRAAGSGRSPVSVSAQMRPLTKSAKMYWPENSGNFAPRYTGPPVIEKPCEWSYSKIGATEVKPAGAALADGPGVVPSR